jgi:hypothetical protein
MKRTDNDTLNDINDAPDLQRLVQDKRSLKRSNQAKGTVATVAMKTEFSTRIRKQSSMMKRQQRYLKMVTID